MSANVSIDFESEIPAPWPACVSILISRGFSPCCFSCKVAANLKECEGTTLSSWSGVNPKLAGYSFFLMLCKGESLIRYL